MLKQHKEQIVKHFRRNELDTGSSEVQIALLTYRIKGLTEHFKANKKDNNGRVGLVKLVNRRRRLLKYLKSENLNSYTKLIGELGLRK